MLDGKSNGRSQWLLSLRSVAFGLEENHCSEGTTDHPHVIKPKRIKSLIDCQTKIRITTKAVLKLEQLESEILSTNRNSQGVETCNSRSMVVNIHFYHIWKP